MVSSVLHRDDPSCVRRVAVDSASPSLLRLMKNVSPILFGWLRTACVSRSDAYPPALTYAPAGVPPTAGAPRWGPSDREVSATQARTPQYLMHGGMPEQQLHWVLALEVQGAWTEAPAPWVHCPRRHASPHCEIDTATFVDRHNIHGSLPMVSENNLSIERMFSNAENQVVGLSAESHLPANLTSID